MASCHPVCPRFPLRVSDGSFGQATQRREHGFLHFPEPFLHVASGLEAFAQAHLEESRAMRVRLMCDLQDVGPPYFCNRNLSHENPEACPLILELSITVALYTSLYRLYLLLYFTASLWSQLPLRGVYGHYVNSFTFFSYLLPLDSWPQTLL